jgi:hypothetical protein
MNDKVGQDTSALYNDAELNFEVNQNIIESRGEYDYSDSIIKIELTNRFAGKSRGR